MGPASQRRKGVENEVVESHSSIMTRHCQVFLHVTQTRFVPFVFINRCVTGAGVSGTLLNAVTPISLWQEVIDDTCSYYGYPLTQW